jgi:antitoxin (DNA-binding transcriptional repressor) of toxin-antitoxin stability system
MPKTISATEAARTFSDILSQVQFRGERYTIARGGKPIASVGPAAPPVRLTLKDAIEVLKQLPSLGDDARAFARTVSRSARRVSRPPKRSAWA